MLLDSSAKSSDFPDAGQNTARIYFPYSLLSFGCRFLGGGKGGTVQSQLGGFQECQKERFDSDSRDFLT